MQLEPVYIYDAIRSPRTRAKETGGLHDLTPHELLKQLYTSLQQRTGLDPALVGEIVLGNVTQSGEQAANIAKTSALYAGWPYQVNGITVNRFCSSGVDAISIAAMKIACGQEQVAIAGGIEMMSRVPMLSDKAAVFMDPKYAAQCQMLMMGSGADLIASLHEVSREQADKVALLSQQRAAQARRAGYFTSIVDIYNSAQKKTVNQDECIREQTTFESLAELDPAFAKLGAQGVDALQLAANPDLKAIKHIHTAGNSPAMCDGATVVLLGDATLGKTLGIAPRARVVDGAVASDDPLQVLGGCVTSAGKLMAKHNLKSEQIDLFELHEAFAATVIRCQRELNIPEEKLNVNGGVIALGHPMGATGAMMVGMLLDELERTNKHRGLVAASGAAGSGSALLIERD